MLYLDDFYGGRCRTLVQTGDRVLLGQIIGLPESGGAAVHASVSGTVRAIGGGAVVIENDGRDTPAPETHPLPSLEDGNPQQLLAGLEQMGLLTAEHLPLVLPKDRPCPLLGLSVLSQASQSQTSSEQMLGGFLALVRLLKHRRVVLLRDKRRPAHSRLLEQFGIHAEDWALDPHSPLPVEQLTGAPAVRGLSLGDQGCVVLDAQGAAAVWDGLYSGQPYIRRQVLITGTREALSVTVPIGTAVGHILSALDLSPTSVLLSGHPLRQLQTPIAKGDSVIALHF